jgi:hypothetical protein
MSKRRCQDSRDLQARDLVPEVRLVDSGYVSGEGLATHAELGIELVGPLKQEGGWQHETGYGVSAFQVDWDKQQVRCRKAAPLAELVSGTTQSRRGGDPGELFGGPLSCLSSQRALYQAGEGQGENCNPFASIRRRGALVSPNATRQPCLSAALCEAEQASKARFLRGFAATACAAHAIVASQSHRGGHQLGAHPSDAATHGSWPLASAQASSVAFCTLTTTLGSMMSGQNFPAES